MNELISELTEYVEGATRDLGDEQYLEVMEGVSCNLDASVEAKREEQRNADAG